MSDSHPGIPVVVGDLEIEPIERTVVHVEFVCGGLVGVAMKEPVAVIIRSPSGTWRVNLESPDSTTS